MTKNTRNGLIIIGIVVAIGAAGVVFRSDDDHPRRPGASSRADAERMEDNARDAPYVAKQVLESRFKAPSQVEILDRKLLAQKENFALVSVVVDAPNSFGVKLRSRWCYILKYLPPRGDKFVWNDALGVWECSGGIDPNALLIRQTAVGWPGVASPATAETRENTGAK